jgi:hypothetical protein
MSFFEESPENRDDLVAHLVEFGLGRQCVIDGNYAVPRVGGEDCGSAERGFCAIEGMSAAVHIDDNLTVFLPSLGTNIQYGDAANVSPRNCWGIALNDGFGLRKSILLNKSLNLFPAIDIGWIRERRR